MPTLNELTNPEPYTVRRGTSLLLVANAMLEKNVGCAVVVDEERRPIGLLTERDIVKGYLYFPQRKIHLVRSEEVMDSNPVTLRNTDDVTEAAGLLRERGARFAPVVSVEGAIVGLLSSSALSSALPAAE